MANDLLNTAQVATRLKKSKRWIQTLILDGKLPAEMVGKKTYVIRLRDLERYQQKSAKKAKKRRANSNGQAA